jgi:glycosyltransferase involved in cell wall biosynthesis
LHESTALPMTANSCTKKLRFRRRSPAALRVLIIQRTIPPYRLAFFEGLSAQLGDQLQLASGDETPPVKDQMRWRRLCLHSWRGAFWQWIPVRWLLTASVAVIELNPRSLSNWIALIVGRLFGIRILLWGHRENRSGQRPWIRSAMEILAAGVVYYTHEEANRSRREQPNRSAPYVAPNTVEAIFENSGGSRNGVVLSCRLVPEKRPILALQAVALSGLNDCVIHIVGDGPLRGAVEEAAKSLGVTVELYGSLYDPAKLASVYAKSFAALSPGYVGLNVNQAVLSGVPLIYAKNAPHAPEISYADETNSVAVASDSPSDWAAALKSVRLGEQSTLLAPRELAQRSAERLGMAMMVTGMLSALNETPA